MLGCESGRKGRYDMKRKASVQWQGDLKTGKGTVSTESGVLNDVPYSFAKRFGEEKGTNPEELVAAAHASCFTMALSAELGKSNLLPERLRTTCTVTLDKADGGWSVTESHLELTAKVPGASQEVFRKAAEAAETGCPISKLLKAKVTLDARLEP
jgi:osmotically inducible protein OsmC